MVTSGEPDEIVVADTIGVAVPPQVTAVFETIGAMAPGMPLRAHFHDTRNTAVANVVAAIGAGVSSFDSSTGGIGGCPFAPGATGNVATEDLVYLLHRMGVATGISLAGIVPVVRWLEDQLGHRAAGSLARAGNFPKDRPEPTCVA
jgi:hydroxymethylglutaryl-CoA lyase